MDTFFIFELFMIKYMNKIKKRGGQMKKLFFFDIDGTLIECEKGIYEIPENTKKALDKLKRNGNDVFNRRFPFLLGTNYLYLCNCLSNSCISIFWSIQIYKIK